MSRVSSASLVGLAEGAGISAASAGGVGTEWAAGAWVEWDDALADSIYLAGCACHYAGTASLLGIEVATGAAGSESVVVAQAYGSSTGTGNSGGEVLYLFDLPVLIAAGSRVAVRLRFRRNSAQTFNPVRLCWYPSTLSSDFRTRAVGAMLPTVPVACTWSAPAWTWSAWSELTASGLAAGGSIASVAIPNTWDAQAEEAEIGIGAAGAEAAFCRLRGCSGAWGGQNIRLPAPFPVPTASTRLAARFRSAQTSGTAHIVVNVYGPDELSWVPVANFTEPLLDASKYPDGVARVSCDLWTEDKGTPTVRARLVSLLTTRDAEGLYEIDAEVGRSAIITSVIPADASFAVTLVGLKRHRLELTSDTTEIKLFCSPDAEVVP